MDVRSLDERTSSIVADGFGAGSGNSCRWLPFHPAEFCSWIYIEFAEPRATPPAIRFPVKRPYIISLFRGSPIPRGSSKQNRSDGFSRVWPFLFAAAAARLAPRVPRRRTKPASDV